MDHGDATVLTLDCPVTHCLKAPNGRKGDLGTIAIGSCRQLVHGLDEVRHAPVVRQQASKSLHRIVSLRHNGVSREVLSNTATSESLAKGSNVHGLEVLEFAFVTKL
jgi:hypothetical protein